MVDCRKARYFHSLEPLLAHLCLDLCSNLFVPAVLLPCARAQDTSYLKVRDPWEEEEHLSCQQRYHLECYLTRFAGNFGNLVDNLGNLEDNLGLPEDYLGC